MKCTVARVGQDGDADNEAAGPRAAEDLPGVAGSFCAL